MRRKQSKLVGSGTHLDTNIGCLVYLGTNQYKQRGLETENTVALAYHYRRAGNHHVGYMQDKYGGQMSGKYGTPICKMVEKKEEQMQDRTVLHYHYLASSKPECTVTLDIKIQTGSAKKQIVQRQEGLSLQALFLIRIHCISVFQLLTP